MKKIIVTLLLLPTILFSQGKKLQKADSLFNKQEYIDAIKIYKSCIDNGNQNPVILEKIANAYYNNASYIEANTWYTKLYDKSPKMKGEYHYRYDSGREGDMARIGFSPRKGQTVLYITDGFAGHAELMAELGKYKTGKSCLYIKRLSDVDEAVLEQLCAASLKYMDSKYPE